MAFKRSKGGGSALQDAARVEIRQVRTATWDRIRMLAPALERTAYVRMVTRAGYTFMSGAHPSCRHPWRSIMQISMYQTTAPTFAHMLANLVVVLKKGEAHALDKKI